MRIAVYNILISPPQLTGEVTIPPEASVHGSVQRFWDEDGHFGKVLLVVG